MARLYETTSLMYPCWGGCHDDDRSCLIILVMRFFLACSRTSFHLSIWFIFIHALKVWLSKQAKIIGWFCRCDQPWFRVIIFHMPFTPVHINGFTQFLLILFNFFFTFPSFLPLTTSLWVKLEIQSQRHLWHIWLLAVQLVWSKRVPVIH